MFQTYQWARMVKYASLVAIMLCFIKCSNTTETAATEVSDILGLVYGPYRLVKLPITKGVRILNPIQLALGPGQKLFAANQSGEVYTLNDSDGDGLEDEALQFCNIGDYKLRSPSGFAYKGDTVYIGTAQEIRIFLDKDKDGKSDTSWTFFNDIPHSEHPYEWTSAMNFGPDGWLYFALSTDSWNAGASPDPKLYRGAILRISPDGKQAEKFVTGIRSVNSSAFNQSGDLFFIDNEGGGNPTEELNLAIRNSYYGHNPDKYKGKDSTKGPAHSFDTEVAPAAIVFNSPGNDFGGTAGDLFVAFYGPGERWKRGGIGRVKIERNGDGTYSYQEFAIADIPKLSAMAFGKDGSLYIANHGIADYWYNSIEEKSGEFYKIVYDKSVAKFKARSKNSSDLSQNSIEAGKQLFAESACSACHALEGAELLGPNLKGVGSRLSREDIIEEIVNPSKIIKPSMGAMKITKKDGQVLLGRVVNSNEMEISLMLIGNQVVVIPRDQIAKSENEAKSLMYENLLNGMKQEEIKSLLDYIQSLK